VVDRELLQLSATSKMSHELIRQHRRIRVREITAQLGVGHHELRENRPKKKRVILQHDNARPHTARLTLQTIQKNGWELLSHSPYSPQLAPSDCHLGKVTTMRLTRQSRKPCEAGCEELERTSTAEASSRFCNAGRNVQIGM
jgi:hypothetical protein